MLYKLIKQCLLIYAVIKYLLTAFVSLGSRNDLICNYGQDKIPKCHGFGKVCIASPSKAHQIFTCVCEVGFVGSARTCEGTVLVPYPFFALGIFQIMQFKRILSCIHPWEGD